MLGAHLVVGAVVSPLEHGPERLDAVGVGLAFDVLADAVTDSGVIEVQTDPVVSAVVVRVDGGPRLDPLLDEALQAILVRVLDDLSLDLVGGAVLGPDDRRFPNPSTPNVELLIGVLVLLFATDIGFVHFDGAGESRQAVFPICEVLSNPVGQVPG